MQDLPFDLIGLPAEDVQTLEDTYKLLNEKFSVGIPSDVHFPVKNFDLFSISNDIKVGGILSINGANNFYLVFLKIRYSGYGMYNASRYNYDKYKVWAFIKTNKDYGRALIRHETLNDRIIGLIHPCELNFKDDKHFDHKFYVVCNDEQKALLAMNWNFRNAVMEMGDGMMLETVDKDIIIGSNINLDPRNTIDIAEFASKIAALR